MQVLKAGTTSIALTIQSMAEKVAPDTIIYARRQHAIFKSVA
jgi:hypothetical protein